MKGKNSKALSIEDDVHFPSQRATILEMLRSARAEGRGVGPQEFMFKGIAHYCRRIYELRQRDFFIDNERRWDASGRRWLSSYWLKHDPEVDGNER